jgi:hypothetical protein
MFAQLFVVQLLTWLVGQTTKTKNFTLFCWNYRSAEKLWCKVQLKNPFSKHGLLLNIKFCHFCQIFLQINSLFIFLWKFEKKQQPQIIHRCLNIYFVAIYFTLRKKASSTYFILCLICLLSFERLSTIKLTS